MQRNECSEFESAVYADSEVRLALRRHAERCERCGSLQEVVALSGRPLATERTDPFAARVIAAATEMSRKRAADWERRRRVAPVLIGAAGYVTTICGLVSSAMGRGLDRAGPAPLTGLSLPPLPAPDSFSITAVMLVSAAAMVLVAVVTRGRQLLSAWPGGSGARAPR